MKNIVRFILLILGVLSNMLTLAQDSDTIEKIRIDIINFYRVTPYDISIDNYTDNLIDTTVIITDKKIINEWNVAIKDSTKSKRETDVRIIITLLYSDGKTNKIAMGRNKIFIDEEYNYFKCNKLAKLALRTYKAL